MASSDFYREISKISLIGNEIYLRVKGVHLQRPVSSVAVLLAALPLLILTLSPPTAEWKSGCSSTLAHCPPLMLSPKAKPPVRKFVTLKNWGRQFFG